MSDAMQVLQAAAISVLQAHPVLGAELTGIFDGPPPRAAFPYVSIASLVFLRAIVVRDPVGAWAGLVEHRVRMLAV